MNNSFKLIVFVFFFVFMHNTKAFVTHFSRLGVNEGLPQPVVRSIYQDELGTVWFGTRQGLCKYNGFNIETVALHKDYSSPVGKTVSAIYGNRNGKLFILMNDQLISYDLESEKQTLLTNLSVSYIYASNEHLVFSSGNSIYLYNYTIGEYVEIAALPQKCFPISSILITKSNKILVSTNDGVMSLDLTGKSINSIVSGIQCTAIKDAPNNCYWVGTKSNGLLYVNGNNEIKPVLGKHFNESAIRCIEVDSQNTVWFGTFNGLHSYSPLSHVTTTYTHDERKPYSLSHSSVYAIFEDDFNTIWVGTYFGGISYFNPQRDDYRFYNVSKDDPHSLNHPIVGNMLEDNVGDIWICTEGGGLNQLSRKSGKITIYEHSENENSISHNNLKAIWHDSIRNKLYIGTHTGGMSVMDIPTKKFSRYTHNPYDPSSLPNDVITNFASKGDSLFIATQNGIALFDLNTNEIGRFQFKNDLFLNREDIIHNIYIDSQKRMWLLLNADSLISYDLENGGHMVFKHDPKNPDSFTKSKVNKIIETKDNKLLFVTEGDGIMQFDENSMGFVFLTRENSGLISNYFYGICETDSGKLIFTSNNGLTIFDQRNGLKTFLTIKKNIPLSGFIEENGLFVSKSGEIFIGGIGGMVVLPEAKFDFSSGNGSLYFSKLIVNNQIISANDSTGILEKSIAYTNKIKLKAHQNNVALEFSVSDYSSGFQKVFEYKLKGFGEEWIPIPGNRIVLANVPHGVYSLELRPIQSSLSDNSSILSMEIDIMPPFYASNLAFAIYAFLIISIVFAILRINKIRTHLKYSIVFERKEKEKTEQLNRSKLEFFTNISHELRTPLSLINGHVDILINNSQFKKSEVGHIQKIKKQAILLRDLTEELLTIHKYDSGFGRLSVAPIDIVELVNEVYLAHKTNAEAHGIEMSFHHSCDKAILYLDAVQINKVVNNLLSNAIKFTPKDGFVRILVNENQNAVSVSVSDSGCGIAIEDQAQIFERYYQSGNKTNTGFGLGLALSKKIIELHKGDISLKSQLNNGSTFMVSLQKGSEHFAGLDYVKYNDASISAISVPDDFFFSEIKSQLPESKIAPNILIVEDNIDLLELLVEIMSPIYQVRVASNGEDGWQMCKEHLPDLVLSDLLMPRMSGMDLCKCIKSNYETSHIPVVILTAVSSSEKSIESFLFGADEYIKKPFDSRNLIARCNSLIGNRILLRKKYIADKAHKIPVLATSENDHGLLKQMNEVIDANLTNDSFTVDDIAKEMNLGRSRFYLKIKEITSLTPNEYLLKYKMQKAMEMVQTDLGLNISEIAFKVGFKSPRYFAKCFKDHFGITPSSVRSKEEEAPDVEMEH